MKSKKLGSLICFVLVLSVFIPAISIAYARKTGRGPLEKIVFIHYRKGAGKPPGTPGNGPPDKPDNGDEGDYQLLGKGVKWKTTATIVIDPDYSGLNKKDVQRVIELSAEEWDDGAYSGWDGVPVDLFDGYSIVYDATFDTDKPDGRNEVLFGDYPQENVIAVTVIWGYFRGPPSQREIIEFDIMFDTDYTWSLSGESDKMDLQNIATHELGHGAGLDDLYDTVASEETMYGYSYNGDIKKRDLYFGDIAGIKELYG